MTTRAFLAAPLTLALAAFDVRAQASSSATLPGRVVDASSGRALPDAEVRVVPGNLRLTTDDSGQFRAQPLIVGVYTVEIRRVGYQMFSDTVSVVENTINRRDFRVWRVVVVDTVQTNAPAIQYLSPNLRGFEERRKTGHGYYIAEEELRKAENRTLGSVLKRLPGVTVRGHRSAEYVASSRSAGQGQAGALARVPPPRANPTDRSSPTGCWTAVYVDGVAIHTGPPQPAPDLTQFQVSELAAVEFYPGPAGLPAQFSAMRTSDCGVLLLWTRER